MTTHNVYGDLEMMLTSLAGWVKSYRFEKDFNLIHMDESIEGHAAIGFSSWYHDDHGIEIIMGWSVLLPDVMRSPVCDFRVGEPPEFIDELIKDPQKFIDELQIFAVHNS